MTKQNPYTFIDLFAGIGGIRMAFENAGFTCVYSNEKNNSAAETYRKNFGEIDCDDIRNVEIEKIPCHDVLCAGFPCQPFSRAGVSARSGLSRDHGFDDKEQGDLFFEIVKILAYHKPKAVFLENVANLIQHDKGRTLERIIFELETLGYKDPRYKILDASLVVPHRRKRIYIVATLDPIDFQFPLIVQGKHRLKDILEKNVPEQFTISDLLWRSHKKRTERNKRKGNGFAHNLVDINGNANTLTARYGKDGRENLITQEGKNPRMLTPRECARLMGFPDDFKLPPTKTPSYRQLGNSVCVPVVTLIAQELSKQLMKNEHDAISGHQIVRTGNFVLSIS